LTGEWVPPDESGKGSECPTGKDAEQQEITAATSAQTLAVSSAKLHLKPGDILLLKKLSILKPVFSKKKLSILNG